MKLHCPLCGCLVTDGIFTAMDDITVCACAAILRISASTDNRGRRQCLVSASEREVQTLSPLADRDDQYRLKQINGSLAIRGCGANIDPIFTNCTFSSSADVKAVDPSPPSEPTYSFKPEDLVPLIPLADPEKPPLIPGYYVITSVEPPADPSQNPVTVERNEENPNRYWIKVANPNDLSELPPITLPPPAEKTWRDRAIEEPML